MNDTHTLYRRFALGVTLMTLIAALLRVPSLCLFFDRTVGYCDPNVFSTLLYIAVPLFLLLCTAYVILMRRCEKAQQTTVAPHAAAKTKTVLIASILATLVFVGVATWEAVNYTATSYEALLRIVGALLAAVYFAVPNKQKVMVLGLGTHLYCVFVLVTEYFDWTVPMNSPLKTMQQAAMITALLFMTVELNHLNDTRRSIRYAVCAALAVFFGFSSSISLVAAFPLGGIVRTDMMIHSLPALAISLYALARLFSYHTIELPVDQKEDQINEAENAPAEQGCEQSPQNEERDTAAPDEPTSDTQASPTTPEEDHPSHG